MEEKAKVTVEEARRKAKKEVLGLRHPIPEGATEEKITSESWSGGRTRTRVQITVAFRDGETGKRRSVTLHLRRHHGGGYADLYGRRWAV